MNDKLISQIFDEIKVITTFNISYNQDDNLCYNEIQLNIPNVNNTFEKNFNKISKSIIDNLTLIDLNAIDKSTFEKLLKLITVFNFDDCKLYKEIEFKYQKYNVSNYNNEINDKRCFEDEWSDYKQIIPILKSHENLVSKIKMILKEIISKINTGDLEKADELKRIEELKKADELKKNTSKDLKKISKTITKYKWLNINDRKQEIVTKELFKGLKFNNFIKNHTTKNEAIFIETKIHDKLIWEKSIMSNLYLIHKLEQYLEPISNRHVVFCSSFKKNEVDLNIKSVTTTFIRLKSNLEDGSIINNAEFNKIDKLISEFLIFYNLHKIK